MYYVCVAFLKANYTLTLEARDQGGPQRTGSVTVEVEIRDVNDNPPVVNHPNRTLYLQVGYLYSPGRGYFVSQQLINLILLRETLTIICN